MKTYKFPTVEIEIFKVSDVISTSSLAERVVTDNTVVEHAIDMESWQ